ncbi:MAG: acetyl-CoA C-acetyltransferase [Mycobacterium sp.]|nr:acetyl-CoA C-acetyltransferase [Mycobacterium sp.]
MPEAVVVSTARTPIGRAGKGSLKDLRADDLAAHAVLAALTKIPELDPIQIDDLMLGVGQPAGESGNNLGRAVAVLAGLDHLPGVTVNRYCSSSLQTTRMALHAIRSGEGDVFISAGVETVSRYFNGASDNPEGQNPAFAEAQSRTAARAQHNHPWNDPRASDQLPDLYIAMGQTAENVAQFKGVSRADQDAFAVRSQNRAEAATACGFWARDIAPVPLPDGSYVSTDDCPRTDVTLEAVSALPPVFRRNGTVTAGNSCPLNDGAAALVVMSDTKAAALGITPLARIVSTGVTGLSPEIMGLGPVEASKQALQRANLSINDIDLVEINEAFAAQVIPSMRELRIDEDKVNINGGAIALGHPFGMTGARITSTLINSMVFHNKQFGLETMCVGGGQGMAMILERLS